MAKSSVLHQDGRVPDISTDALPRWAATLVVFAISTFIIESPLKFALGKIGLSSAIYLRDVIAFGVVGWMVLRWLTGSRLNASTLVLAILLAHAFYGVLQMGSIAQPFIAFKIYIYLLLGTAIYPTLVRHTDEFKSWSTIMLTMTLLGIFINYFTEMPWSGEVFDSAAGATEISREWTTGGIRRLSGFARASYDAATIAVLLGSATCILQIKKKSAKIFLLSVISVAVFMTTSKGAILALAFLIPYILLHRSDLPNSFPRSMHLAPSLMLAPPAIFYISEYKAKIGGDLWFLLSSFSERINWMWPRAFDLLQTPWNIPFGRGLGGIGFPQRFGEGAQYNSADNAMLYLFISFGLLSIFYIHAIFSKLDSNKSQIPSPIWGCMICWLIYWAVYGFTTNLFENPVISIFFGITIGAALTRRMAPS